MRSAPRSESLAAARLSTPAVRNLSDGKCVTGVQIPDGIIRADAVISTIPTPLVSATVPDLPRDWKGKYDAIHTIGICCRAKRQKLHFEAARCSLVRRSHREKIFFFYTRLEFNSKPPLFESTNYPIGV